MDRSRPSAPQRSTAVRTAGRAALDLLLPATAGKRGEPAPDAKAGPVVHEAPVFRQPQDGRRVRRGSPSRPAARNLELRSGLAVHLGRFPGAAQKAWHLNQHGWPRAARSTMFSSSGCGARSNTSCIYPGDFTTGLELFPALENYFHFYNHQRPQTGGRDPGGPARHPVSKPQVGGRTRRSAIGRRPICSPTDTKRERSSF